MTLVLSLPSACQMSGASKNHFCRIKMGTNGLCNFGVTWFFVSFCFFLYNTIFWRFFFTNFFYDFFWQIFENFFCRFFWRIFLKNLLMNFLTNFLTYNLLTVASFRIGVPSILFIHENPQNDYHFFYYDKQRKTIFYILVLFRYNVCSFFCRFFVRKNVHTLDLKMPLMQKIVFHPSVLFFTDQKV